jgi:hypothetical protein
MRFMIAALAGFFLSATLLGCGASTTIPLPPTDAKEGPPPGTEKNISQSTKGAAGGLGAAGKPKKYTTNAPAHKAAKI